MPNGTCALKRTFFQGGHTAGTLDDFPFGNGNAFIRVTGSRSKAIQDVLAVVGGHAGKQPYLFWATGRTVFAFVGPVSSPCLDRHGQVLDQDAILAYGQFKLWRGRHKWRHH